MRVLERGHRASGTKSAPSRRLVAVGLAVAAGLSLVLLANAHLVYMAFISQPDCVAHARTAGEAPGAFRAAKSSC